MRAFLNPNWTNSVNALPAIARDGFFGLGHNYVPGLPSVWNTTGPASLLHLNGPDGTYMGLLGYRNWMKNGITFTANNDMMYVGPRRNGNLNDFTDAVFSWSDNGSGEYGPDNMVFSYTTGDGTTIGSANGDLTGLGPDGREVMRLTAIGNIGMGPRFNNTNQPQSQLHINSENSVPAWLQISNQNTLGASYSPNNGFRIGVANTTAPNGSAAYLFNQSNNHMIFSTGNSTASLGNERMRITHYGAPGINQPPGSPAANNSTRVGISLTPGSLTNPWSLLHIGNNAGAGDGVRNWMNNGITIAQGTDHMYIGLKQEDNADRQDAIINWGDNPTNLIAGQGPDNLRFVFTSTTTGITQQTPANSNQGLEIARMTPQSFMGIGHIFTNTVQPKRRLDVYDDGQIVGSGLNPALPNTADGRAQLRLTQTLAATDAASVFTDFQTTGAINTLGAGNLLINPTNLAGAKGFVSINMLNATTAANPNLSLDVNGQQNIRTVNNNDALNQVLVWDPSMNGRVLWRDASTLGGAANANNGCSIDPLNPGIVQLGNDVGQTNAQLLNDREIPMNDFNIVFTQAGFNVPTNTNCVGIGTTSPAAKFHVSRGPELNDIVPVAGLFINRDVGANGTPWVGNSIGIQVACSQNNLNSIGGEFRASMARFNTAVNGIGFSSSIPFLSNSYGAILVGQGNGNRNHGVFAMAQDITALENYGGLFTTSLAQNGSYGIYTTAPIAPNSWAAWVNGDGFVTSTWTVSDQNLKTNIEPVHNALDILQQLQPSRYDYLTQQYPSMNLPAGNHYGFLAQNLESVLPGCVKEAVNPAQYDTLGNVIHDAVPFKAVNYIEIIPILAQGIKEEDQKVSQMQELLAQMSNMMEVLNNKVQQLEYKANQLSQQLLECCQSGMGDRRGHAGQPENEKITRIFVEITENDVIFLGQNVPNPFLEQTQIPFYLPERVKSAQISIADAKGAVIKVIDINERGKGIVYFSMNTLDAAVYYYSLIVDGKIHDTKRMVKN
jgi:hypothetical protein